MLPSSKQVICFIVEAVIVVELEGDGCTTGKISSAVSPSTMNGTLENGWIYCISGFFTGGLKVSKISK